MPRITSGEGDEGEEGHPMLEAEEEEEALPSEVQDRVCVQHHQHVTHVCAGCSRLLWSEVSLNRHGNAH